MSKYIAHLSTTLMDEAFVGLDLALTGEWSDVYDKAKSIGKILGFDLDYIEEVENDN